MHVTPTFPTGAHLQHYAQVRRQHHARQHTLTTYPHHAFPQVPIFNIMRKFDGTTITDDIRLGRRRMRILRLPPFLCMHMRRFTKNNFFTEKNPTIVNFPVKNLELRDILPLPEGGRCGECGQRVDTQCEPMCEGMLHLGAKNLELRDILLLLQGLLGWMATSLPARCAPAVAADRDLPTLHTLTLGSIRHPLQLLISASEGRQLSPCLTRSAIQV